MNKPIGIISRKHKNITVLQRIMTILVESSSTVVVAPSQIALCLSSYKKRYDLGVKCFWKVKLLVDSGVRISGKNVKPVYDFIAHMQNTVVALYRAVETSANLSIPDDFEYKKKRSQGVWDAYTKEAIERKISTSEKIADILPVVIGVPSPNGQDFWDGFLAFEELRNEIIHPKSGNFERNGGEFLDVEFQKKVAKTVELIGYFVTTRPNDRRFPVGFGKSEVPIFATEDIEQRFVKFGET